jgi:hypothetical protein
VSRVAELTLLFPFNGYSSSSHFPIPQTMSSPRPSHLYRILPSSHPITASSIAASPFQPLVPGLTSPVILCLSTTLLLAILLLASSTARSLLSPLFSDEVVFYGAAIILLGAMGTICIGAMVLQGRLDKEDEQRRSSRELGTREGRRIVDDD